MVSLIESFDSIKNSFLYGNTQIIGIQNEATNDYFNSGLSPNNFCFVCEVLVVIIDYNYKTPLQIVMEFYSLFYGVVKERSLLYPVPAALMA